MLTKEVADDLLRQVSIDAHGDELAHHTSRAMPPYLRFRAGDGGRGAQVVECALILQTCDGGRSGGWGVAPFGQPIAHLVFGQLAGGKPSERAEICGFGRIGFGGRAWFFQEPKRVNPGMTLSPPVTFLAISSRAVSDVVEMPWTFSLNSSTFDAQRNASS